MKNINTASNNNTYTKTNANNKNDDDYDKSERCSAILKSWPKAVYQR